MSGYFVGDTKIEVEGCTFTDTKAEFVAEAMRLADAMAHTARRVGSSHGPTEYADCYAKFDAARAALLAHLEARP